MANHNPKPIVKNKSKKGCPSPNPKGNTANDRPVVKKQYQILSHAYIAEIGNILLTGNLPELKKIIDEREDGKRTVLEIWIASCAYKAIIKGEVDPIMRLLDRFVGKVPDQLEVHAVKDRTVTIEFVESDGNGNPVTTIL